MIWLMTKQANFILTKTMLTAFRSKNPCYEKLLQTDSDYNCV